MNSEDGIDEKDGATFEKAGGSDLVIKKILLRLNIFNNLISLD